MLTRLSIMYHAWNDSKQNIVILRQAKKGKQT